MIAGSLLKNIRTRYPSRIELDDAESFRRRREYELRRSMLSKRGYTVVIVSPKTRLHDMPAIAELPHRLQRLRRHMRRTDFIGSHDSEYAIGILFTDIAKDQQCTCNAIFQQKLEAAGFGIEYEITQINSWSAAKIAFGQGLGSALTPAEFAVRLRDEYRRYLRDGVTYAVSKHRNWKTRGGMQLWVGTPNFEAVKQCAKEGEVATWSVDGPYTDVLLLQPGSTKGGVELVARPGTEVPEFAQRITFEPHPTGDWRKELDATRRFYETSDVAPRSASGLVAKRLLDIVGSGLGLLIGAPLFLLLAAGVKLSSPGPVLFRQKRVGQFGKEFTFLKFRSMKNGNDTAVHEKFVADLMALQAATEGREGENGNPVYKMVNDSRITRFGGLIRKTSLDELPQLINVFCGDMSLVGPRPPIPYEVDRYAPWHLERLIECKPGITGLWQVEGRSRVGFNDMVRMDLRYAREWSLWFDIKLLIRTIGVVFKMTGAR